ncbi:MAG: OsmC family protein [Anaerolineales bacterium]|jgi:putative redox protein|nr:OsmC family protein [Anaerolineales bacterium]
MSSIILRWVEEKLMVASDSHGFSIAIGRSPDPAFEWAGVKPSDLLLMAVAACSAYDVVEILTKQREPLEDLKIICEGKQLDSPPYTFTNVHLRYEVHGAVNEEKLRRAIQLSEDKYCSVISTLRLGVPVTSEYELCG